MNKTKMAYAAIAALVLALLGLLVAKTRGVDFDGHNEVLALLRQLKQIDAEWNVDVLRSRTGLNASYDPVASPLPVLESLEAALRSKSDELWSTQDQSGTRVQSLLDAYRRTMDEKVTLIERFKSQNSILRNSSRFLPVAAQDLVEAAGASRVGANALDDTGRALNALLTATMTYVQTPDAALRESIEAGSRNLQQLVSAMAPDVRDTATTLVRHVDTVLKQQEATNRLLIELAAVPTARAVDDLADAARQEHEAVLATQQSYRNLLVLYSGFLLALLAWLGWRLFRNFRLLHKSNTALRESHDALKESQSQLVQAEKMSALGQMVAGIAHEINTPLAYVKGTFDVLKEQLAPVHALAVQNQDFTEHMRRDKHDQPALSQKFLRIESSTKSLLDRGLFTEMGQLLSDGVHGIEQISEIVLNLKNFSRIDRAKVTEYSVRAGLQSTLLLARNLLKNRVEIREEHGEVPDIECSPSQINQVFLNIITNAVHAIPPERKACITLRTAIEDANTVRVEIQDNGSGIEPDVLTKIFDPFFTTKPIGRGTGLGLSISYKIIQDHGGRIVVDTELGVGTVFTVLLPVHAAAAPDALIEEEALFAA